MRKHYSAVKPQKEKAMNHTPLEAYKNAGFQAGEANKHQDSRRLQYFSRWFTKAIRLEIIDDRPKLYEIYNEAYREGKEKS